MGNWFLQGEYLLGRVVRDEGVGKLSKEGVRRGKVERQ